MDGKSLDDLAPFGRELTVASLKWSEQFWDGEAGLLAIGSNFETAHRNVRNSIWYALGLLMRGGDGDLPGAVMAIGAVLDNQLDEPGTIYHGTFYRYVGEPHPPENPTTWRDFDPNWRQFIGTTLAIILEEYAEGLPDALVKRVDRAIQLAVEGEPPDRCAPSYTNIALMKAGLMTWAGDRYGRAEWTRDGEAFGEAVYGLFTAHGTFDEYNSPTYYGVNFYALAFWRLYSHSALLVKWGAEIEAEVWRDVAQYYHAGLKNVCGPFTRSYGMDMPNYGALLGMSIWLGIGQTLAPFPDEVGYFDHSSDFCYGPCFGMVDTMIPEDVLSHFKAFSGERLIEKRISTTPDRVATAWLSDKVMIGAEATPLDGSEEETYYKMSNQFHSATIHWKMPDGNVGWMRLRHLGAVNAKAEKGRLIVAGKMEQGLANKYGDDHKQFVFELHVPRDVAVENIRADRWDLPGLSMRVESNVGDPRIEQDGDKMNVIYTVTDLDFKPQIAFAIQ
ncbi:MAG: hypothetical protein QGG64_20265 [Candidatus Latescibacteria bacterium]|nr:hypothetical protein [Candidatus Latescibacterota bacterium]